MDVTATAAQPVWNDDWNAWLHPDPRRPGDWLRWDDASSAWQPLLATPVPAPVATTDLQPTESPAPAARPVSVPQVTVPFAADPTSSPTAPVSELAPAPAAAAPAPQPTLAQPSPVDPSPYRSALDGPFVPPSASQRIDVPAPRPVGELVVPALAASVLGAGVLATLLGVGGTALYALGIGVVPISFISVLSVLAFLAAGTGVVLGALQLRRGRVQRRERLLLAVGVCGTVALVLLGRGVGALANSMLLGYPL